MKPKIYLLHVAIWTFGLSPIWGWPLAAPWPPGNLAGVFWVAVALGIATALWGSLRAHNRFSGEPSYFERVARIKVVCYRDIDNPGRSTVLDILDIAEGGP